MDNLEERISELEESQKGSLRFFTQYILSPLLVVAIGVLVNYQIEQNRQQFQQIRIAQSMLSTLFSDDEFQTLATRRLLDEVLQDEGLKREIGDIVADYMRSKFVESSSKATMKKQLECTAP